MSIVARVLGYLDFQLAWEPADLNSAGANGDWVAVPPGGVGFLLLMGDGTGSYDITLTVQQATDNAGSGVKVCNCLETGKIYTEYGATYAAYALLSEWTKITQATADEQYADATNGEAVGITSLQIFPADLDVDGGFCYIRVNASDPGASKIAAGLYVFHGLAYPNSPELLDDPKGN